MIEVIGTLFGILACIVLIGCILGAIGFIGYFVIAFIMAVLDA